VLFGCAMLFSPFLKKSHKKGAVRFFPACAFSQTSAVKRVQARKKGRNNGDASCP
jgi:hypothetical protein